MLHSVNPALLTEVKGIVDRFLRDPYAGAAVLMLTDGTEVHFPPCLSTRLVEAIKPGGEVMVRGVRSHEADMVAAVSLETADGTRIVTQEPRAPLFRHH